MDTKNKNLYSNYSLFLKKNSNTFLSWNFNCSVKSKMNSLEERLSIENIRQEHFANGSEKHFTISWNADSDCVK